ncbi:hypothetical protein BASA50_000138 [Batrachochytrium salamandrivorans]|uniref:Extracellular metalloproteinase n=1 Tax=Batrachochytrium salamandrivorans TaxID=1357716 RepID=A0ABQ8EY84_9FUNG|nr:hypothetical protein BASA50_000138 [Batrachochytrium salamandrivorans]
MLREAHHLKRLSRRVRGVFDPTPPSQTPRYTVMGVINAFYVANLFHDITYQYGFTEQAGNFQMNNFNKGGKGGDPVVIDIQRSKETDSADFSTPLDGQPGVLTIYISTATEPSRDPALDNTAVDPRVDTWFNCSSYWWSTDKNMYDRYRVSRIKRRI